MSEGDATSDLMLQVEALWAQLSEVLAGMDEALLATRPPNGDRSVVENLRHLLFAEEAHLGRLLPRGPRFSELGLPPPGIQRQERFAMTRDVHPSSGEVFAQWVTSHAYTRGACDKDSPEVRKAIARHLQHQRSHVQMIERLLRAQGRNARGAGVV